MSLANDDIDELIVLANQEIAKSQYDKAYKLASHAKHLSTMESQAIRLAKSLNIQGTALYHLSDFTGALDFHQQALVISENQDNQDLTASILSNIGNIHLQLNDYETALITYQRVYENYLNTSPRTQVKILTNYGYTLFKNLNTSEALKKFDRAIKIIEQEELHVYKIYYLIMRSEIARSSGNYEQSMTLLQQALTISEEQNNAILKITTNIEMGVTLYLMSEYQTVIDLILPELDQLKVIGKKDKEEDIHRLLADSYKQLNKFKKALFHREQENEIREQQINLKALQHSNIVSADRALKKQQSELLSIATKHKSELAQQQALFEQKTYIYWIVITVLLLLLIGTQLMRVSEKR